MVISSCLRCLFFFFKQKTAYEMRISDWSSDVCSSDLPGADPDQPRISPRLSPGGSLLAGPAVEGRAARLDDAADRAATGHTILSLAEIGRASCRERVCQYV